MDLKYEYRELGGIYLPAPIVVDQVPVSDRVSAVHLNWEDDPELERYAFSRLMLKHGVAGSKLEWYGDFCIPKLVQIFDEMLGDTVHPTVQCVMADDNAVDYLLGCTPPPRQATGEDRAYLHLYGCLTYPAGTFETRDGLTGYTDPDGNMNVARGVRIICTPSLLTQMAHFRERIDEARVTQVIEQETSINVVSFHPNRGFFLRQIPMKGWPIAETEDLKLHYGDKMVLFHEALVDRLKTAQKGIILFHGKPGTGKTFYIRRLTHELCNMGRTVVLVPRGVVEQIQDPTFTEFMLDQFHDEELEVSNGAVFVVEDAESMVQSRAENPDTAACVSTLLNLTDGILNDLFKIQVIATFNIDIGRVDEAVLRQGRLVAKKEFKELESGETFRLVKHLGISESKVKTSRGMTLSDIYQLRDADTNNILIED